MLLWRFWKANKEDCGIHVVIYAMLALIIWVMWGTQTVYLAAVLATICTASIVSDFLKWRAYYGRIHSDRG